MDFNLPLFDRMGVNPFQHPFVQHVLQQVTPEQKETVVESATAVFTNIMAGNKEPSFSPELQLLFIARGARFVQIVKPVLLPLLQESRLPDMPESDLIKTILQQVGHGSFNERVKAVLDTIAAIQLPQQNAIAPKVEQGIRLIVSVFRQALSHPPSAASASASNFSTLIHQLASHFDIIRRVFILANEPPALPAPPVPMRPFRPFETALQAANPAVFIDGIDGILSHYNHTHSEALSEANGSIEALPPDWRARFEDPNNPVRELTLTNVDLTYRKLTQIAKYCTHLKAITLDNVTCNGSPFFDQAALHHFLPECTVEGASCTHKSGWLHELLSYSDALYLTKEQLWDLYIALHKQEHDAHGAAAHGPARTERLEREAKACLAGIEQLAQSVHDTLQ